MHSYQSLHQEWYSIGIRINRILSSIGFHASTCIHKTPKMCSGHVAHVGKRATTRTVRLLKKKVALDQYNTETKPKTNKTTDNCFLVCDFRFSLQTDCPKGRPRRSQTPTAR